MTLSDNRLQRAVNLYVEHGAYKAAQMLNVKISSLERFLREANVRGMVGKEEEEEESAAKALVLDIETSLMQFFAWSPGKQYMGPDQIVKDWFVHGWAVKWLMEPDTYSDINSPEEAIAGDDKRVVEGIWKFLDHADFVIIHNARFDQRKLNARFIFHGLPPVSPYIVIDTLKIMRKEALFSSNKQDELCKRLGLRRKVEHEGYDLWKKCFYGDAEALKTMNVYNEGDILGLEELYLIIRPYIKSHPNMNLFVEGNGNLCPTCGSEHIKWMDKFYYTPMNKYSCFRCDDCGAIGRSPQSALDKSTKPQVVSVAR